MVAEVYSILPEDKREVKILFYLTAPTENLGVQYIITALKLSGFSPDIIIEPLEKDSINKILLMKKLLLNTLKH